MPLAWGVAIASDELLQRQGIVTECANRAAGAKPRLIISRNGLV